MRLLCRRAAAKKIGGSCSVRIEIAAVAALLRNDDMVDSRFRGNDNKGI